VSLVYIVGKMLWLLCERARDEKQPSTRALVAFYDEEAALA
jgi:hypothetical protein